MFASTSAGMSSQAPQGLPMVASVQVGEGTGYRYRNETVSRCCVTQAIDGSGSAVGPRFHLFRAVSQVLVMLQVCKC